ncbi:cytochrome P450 [Dacryopinax primogenitus]|uniref:Cytochrome P450 n=1 Tax=Dacryopinax primogenitus (strain DJM 731) TaxID=1858805 RepID=M5FSK1_DACPD|nr:cytochrome P450 [Dacryopinax primogenitus]EJT98883.1 cytochrome P450 [Dacryopinax primogenitus]
MNIRAVARFYPMQEHDAAYFALGLIQYPEKKYDKHVHRFATSTISGALYGKRIDHKDGSGVLQKIEEITQRWTDTFMPQNSVVDTLPFLEPVIRRVKWFRKQADDWHEKTTTEGFRLYSAANETDSWDATTTVQDFETNREKYGVSRDDAMWNTLALYMAGQETTHSVMRTFALAMLHNPSVMRAAQSQLDAICESRPPMDADRPRLPYIEGIALETFRWGVPAPTSVLHAASADFVYEGYMIPKGTILIDNLWSQTRDASVYPDPEAFNPSRYLDQSTGNLLPAAADTHDSLLAFGHGRRVCLGRDFALNNVFIACADLLWAFDFSWPIDEHGNAIKCGVDEMVDHAIVVAPRPFDLVLTPRRKDLEERLMAALKGSQAYVVVNSVRAAADIFDRMSGSTSDRPVMIKARQFYVRDLLSQLQNHTLQQVLEPTSHSPPPDVCGMAFYEGYTIPKGTVLIDNLWSQTRDDSVYADPEAFNPSRYLNPSTGNLLPPEVDTHLSLLAFGHGRRACAGRDFALNSVFIACAYLVWAFDFLWPVDEHGNEIKCGVDEMIDHAVVVAPRPFDLVLTPRQRDLEERLTAAMKV